MCIISRLFPNRGLHANHEMNFVLCCYARGASSRSHPSTVQPIQRKTCFASLGWLSFGQYGHLNLFTHQHLYFSRLTDRKYSLGAFVPVQTLLGKDMPARHHHRRIGVCGLAFADRAYEDRMEHIRWWQWNLDLWDHVSTGLFRPYGTGRLTGSSLMLVHCDRDLSLTPSSFFKTGRAMLPAVTAVYSGLVSLRPSSPQNSLVKLLATSSHAALL